MRSIIYLVLITVRNGKIAYQILPIPHTSCLNALENGLAPEIYRVFLKTYNISFCGTTERYPTLLSYKLYLLGNLL